MSGAAGGLGVSLRRAGRWVARTLVEPPLPLLAVEVRPRALAAVRLVREGRGLSLGAAATVELPAGAIEVSLARPNVIDPEAFRGALRAVLERVGALSGGDVSLVLPDPAVRLALVPSDGLRGRRAEAEETDPLPAPQGAPVRRAGGPAGVVLAPGGADAGGGRPRGGGEGVRGGARVARVPAGARRGREPRSPLGGGDGARRPGARELGRGLRVVRAHARRAAAPPADAAPATWGPDAVARHATSTMQFHRDRLGGGALAGVVLRSTVVPGDEAAALLERALEAPVRLLRPWAALGITEEGASAQAVAGAAACVLRRAA